MVLVSVLVLVDVWWVHFLNRQYIKAVYGVSVLVLVDVWWVRLQQWGLEIAPTLSRSLF